MALSAPAFATPDPATHITDRVIGFGDERFLVERVTKQYPGSDSLFFNIVEILEISVWNGRVLSRCGILNEVHRDDDGDGEWDVMEVKPKNPCKLKEGEVSMITPPETLKMDGARIVDGKKQVADSEFVLKRLQAMTKGEVQACEKQNEKGAEIPIGGCSLANSDHKEISIAGDVAIGPSHALIPVRFGDRTDPDMDQALIWIAVGRKYWDPN